MANATHVQEDVLYSLEHEMSVLGSMLLSDRAADEVANLLSPGDFYRVAHREIFGAMLALIQSGKPVSDFEILKQEIKDAGLLETVGGEEYLLEIAQYVPSPANCKYYAEVVKDKSKTRALHKLGMDIAKELTKGSRPIDESIELFTQRISRLSNHKPSTAIKVESFNGAFTPVIVQYIWEPYFPKERVVFTDATGGTGKSSLLLAIAACGSNGKTPVTGEPCPSFRTLWLHRGDDESVEYETVYRATGGQPGFIDYCSYKDDPFCLDTEGLSRLRSRIIEGGYGLVVIDPLFDFLPPRTDIYDQLQAAHIMAGLKEMLRGTGCALAAIRHTAKDVIGKDPRAMGIGCTAWKDRARGQLVARWDPEEKGLVIVEDQKGSLLVKLGEPFAYRRVGDEGRVEWVAKFANPFATSRKKRPAPKLDEFKIWLMATLRQGAIRKDALDLRCEEANYQPGYLYKVHEELGIEIRNQPKGKGEKGRPHTWWAEPGWDWSGLESKWAEQADQPKIEPVTVDPEPSGEDLNDLVEAYDPWADE